VRRAARSPIACDDFIGLAFQRGIGATRPAGGVCRSVGRTCDGHARSSRVRRDGRGGRAPPPLAPSLLGLGIGVGKGWEVVLKYEIRGGEVGGRTIIRNLEDGRGVPKRPVLVPNIGTITSLREGFGGKSTLFWFSESAYY